MADVHRPDFGGDIRMDPRFGLEAVRSAYVQIEKDAPTMDTFDQFRLAVQQAQATGSVTDALLAPMVAQLMTVIEERMNGKPRP